MKQHIICALILGATAFTAPSHATLLISEYIEGSSFNKAIELYNTGDTLDLASGYQLQIYFNGSTSPGQTIHLNGSLAGHDTYVITHNSADTTLLALADLSTSSLSFNGDDAITLNLGDTVMDRIGQIGFDPGSEWGGGETSTQNNTLRRLSTIVAGDSNAFDEFIPALQWQGYAQNSFDGIGQHATLRQIPVPGTLFLLGSGLIALRLSYQRQRPSLAT